MNERRTNRQGARGNLRAKESDSRYVAEQQDEAFAEGKAAAKEAFGNFGELLAKEVQKRNK